MSQASVSAISVVDLAKELKRYKIINTSILSSLCEELPEHVHKLENGLDISFLAERNYPESLLLQLWEYADQSTSTPEIGIVIGSTITREAHGLLAHWMLHSDTLEMALLTYLDNTSLVNASEHWEIERKSDKVELILEFPAGKNYPRCAIERSLISIPIMGEYLCGHKVPIEKVEFTFPRPVYANIIKTLLSCPVFFSKKQNKITLSADILNWQLPRKSAYLRTVIKSRSKNLETHAEKEQITHKIRNLLRDNIGQYSEIENIAQKLHMSRSTLYRKLKSENTSFSELLDGERQQILQDQPNLTASKAYELLGFNDISAYYKARKRWKK